MNPILKYLTINLLFLFLVSCQESTSTQICETISVNSADTLIKVNDRNPNFIILDLRTKFEYNATHIKNGVEFDYYQKDFEKNLDTLIKTKIYLVYCAYGDRSDDAIETMEDLGFKEVYSIDGGIVAWNDAGYTVTKKVTPILLPISNTVVEFKNITIEDVDTIKVTITNFGNGKLKFYEISSLSETEFSTNFDKSKQLNGLMDYSFYFYYKPTDLQNDTTEFVIESSSADLKFVLIGNCIEQ